MPRPFAILTLLTACGFEPGAYRGDDSTASDAAADTRGIDAAIDAFQLGAWAAPTPVAITGAGADDDPTLTADMLEMYFNRANDIYVTTRASLTSDWSTPQVVDALSGASEIETTPEVTSDGTTIFVASNASGTEGSTDIWMSTRATRTSLWDTPTRIASISDVYSEGGSAPTDDLKAIVFTSDATGGSGLSDIYLSLRDQVADEWGTPANLSTVNSASNDYSPQLSADRLTLWFDSTRSGSDDLYVATRGSPTADFGTPVPISELNTAATEGDLWVSPDHRHMFFVRAGVIHETSR